MLLSHFQRSPPYLLNISGLYLILYSFYYWVTLTNESNTIMYDPMLNVAIEAARAAGNIITRAMQRLDTLRIAAKGPNDYVTETDQRVEQEIISIIHKSFPSHGIIGEEGGTQQGDDYQWIIDPIDGTRNFIHGFPHFAVSIALTHKNILKCGLIYDPLRQELFKACRGKGAMLNDRRIRVSARKHLNESLLATGFAYRYATLQNNLPARILQSILPVCGDIRRAGAATLDLAYVACGRLDGFWEMGLHLWDIAAGILLVKEAGGIVCDLQGGEDYMKTGNILAANPILTRQFLQTVKSHMTES